MHAYKWATAVASVHITRCARKTVSTYASTYYYFFFGKSFHLLRIAD